MSFHIVARYIGGETVVAIRDNLNAAKYVANTRAAEDASALYMVRDGDNDTCVYRKVTRLLHREAYGVDWSEEVQFVREMTVGESAA